MSGKTGNIAQIFSDILTCWLNDLLSILEANDWLETSRPELYETEIEIKTDYCETESETATKKWHRDHASLETLTTLMVTCAIQLQTVRDCDDVVTIEKLTGNGMCTVE